MPIDSEEKSIVPAAVAAQCYTAEEVARLLACSLRHVRRLDDARKIPGRIRAGRCVRFSRKLVDRWLAEGGTK